MRIRLVGIAAGACFGAVAVAVGLGYRVGASEVEKVCDVVSVWVVVPRVLHPVGRRVRGRVGGVVAPMRSFGNRPSPAPSSCAKSPTERSDAPACPSAIVAAPRLNAAARRQTVAKRELALARVGAAAARKGA